MREILPDESGFQGRVTHHAKDLVNSCLNYGYGILYNRVQKSLVDAGAALTISFLHESDGNKPTLVYDLIEEFRQYMVDRPVIVMFNRREPVTLDKKGLLTKSSRQLLVENIQERLGSSVKWRGRRWRCEDIISHQARRLVHHLKNEEKYKPFIGRY